MTEKIQYKLRNIVQNNEQLREPRAAKFFSFN